MVAQATFHIYSSQPADSRVRKTRAATCLAENVVGEQRSMAQRDEQAHTCVWKPPLLFCEISAGGKKECLWSACAVFL